MAQAFDISGVGLVNQQRAMDALAHNVANLNTPGFKRVEVRYTDILTRVPVESGGPFSVDRSIVEGAGVRTQTVSTVNEPGEYRATGHELDIAIDGEGFIELMGPSGEIFLTRGGRLKVNDYGQLTDQNGLVLRANVSVPFEAEALIINREGLVQAQLNEGDIHDIGEISLVKIASEEAVEVMDGGLYRVLKPTSLRTMAPGQDGGGTLMQGIVEQSNVDLNDEMVQMMIVQRAYSANAQMVQAADRLYELANNLRR
ncbi:flagellar hook-basal body protein [Woodsholea maritima]|uniref:flagellar hook-basal body protein n=1 Tax=Woodsholea maritima TaxID=240237 RepID=UPI0003812E11|nr:flagellar hook basal-body protein [Woodsholea maritima]